LAAVQVAMTLKVSAVPQVVLAVVAVIFLAPLELQLLDKVTLAVKLIIQIMPIMAMVDLVEVVLAVVGSQLLQTELTVAVMVVRVLFIA
jgi:hypothetical protein